MNSNELCQRMRVTEKQFSKICQHLSIAIPDDLNRTFTPREVERIQFFITRKRSAKNKKISATRQNAFVSEDVAVPVNSEQASVQKSQASSLETSAVSSLAVEEAGAGLRACAYIIDCLVTFILVPLFIVPILGPMLIGILLFLYWLLRDINGTSPGKMILGLQVVNNSGDQVRVGPRIKRNILLAIGPLFSCIPVVGIFIGAPITICMILLEVIMLLATGKRIGDRLGGTSVKIVPKIQIVTE